MMKVAVVVACALVAVAAATEAGVYQYRRVEVGEWVPPPVPAKETPHLSGRVPPPSEELMQSLLEEGARAAPGGRRLLQDPAAAGVAGGKVPHNWFGQGKYKAPLYSISTGKEECDVCKYMIGSAAPSVTKEDPVPGGEGSAAGMGSGPNLCAGIGSKFREMCMGYQQYLAACPSFTHDLCHEDMGGAERLRAPCPEHLKCYYCLRINPNYCL